MKRKLSIKMKFEILVLLMVVLTVSMTVTMMTFEMNRIAKNVSKDYARLYTNDFVSDLEAHLSREIAMTSKEAQSDPIVQDIFLQHQKEGTQSVLIDPLGAIQMNSEFENIRQNSFDTETNRQQSVYQFSDDEFFTEQLENYLKNPEGSTVIEMKTKNYQYAAIAPIENTQWYAVTFFGTSALYDIKNFLPILLLTFLAAIVLAYLINWVMRKIYLLPFEALRASIVQKEMNQDKQLYGLERHDEFGELANTIAKMTDKMVKSVSVGLFLLDKQGTFVYGNPFFLAQFECQHKEEFLKLFQENSATFFTKDDDLNALEAIINQQLDAYYAEVELLTKNKHPFWAEIRLTKVPHEKLGWQYEGILINIQGKKNYEMTLVHLANLDKLTGLYNRTYFDQMVNIEMSRCDRYGGEVTMVMFDLDFFKRVNDTFGHDIGDKVLIETAKIVKKCIRQTDILARWGGEEFTILMPQTDHTSAYQVAEKIRTQLSKRINKVAGVVTASFGVAQRKVGEPFEDWFKRVDGALFWAKDSGRNKVIVDVPKEGISFVRMMWQDSFNSGNDIIDKEHKKLFLLTNELIGAALGDEPIATQIQKFQEIASHVQVHFQNEEAILEKEQLPAQLLKHHCGEHKRLLEAVAELSLRFGEAGIKATDIFLILSKEVVLGHLVKEDAQFFVYLKKKE